MSKANGKNGNGLHPETTEVGQLVPQEHGGALRNGGTNKGGGRPIEAVRIRSRAIYAAVLKAIENKDLEKMNVDELTKIGNLAGKYGVPTQQERGDLGDSDKLLTADERKARVGQIVGRIKSA